MSATGQGRQALQTPEEVEKHVRKEPGRRKVIKCRVLLHRQDEGLLEGQR